MEIGIHMCCTQLRYHVVLFLIYVVGCSCVYAYATDAGSIVHFLQYQGEINDIGATSKKFDAEELNKLVEQQLALVKTDIQTMVLGLSGIVVQRLDMSAQRKFLKDFNKIIADLVAFEHRVHTIIADAISVGVKGVGPLEASALQKVIQWIDEEVAAALMPMNENFMAGTHDSNDARKVDAFYRGVTTDLTRSGEALERGRGNDVAKKMHDVTRFALDVFIDAFADQSAKLKEGATIPSHPLQRKEETSQHETAQETGNPQDPEDPDSIKSLALLKAIKTYADWKSKPLARRGQFSSFVKGELHGSAAQAVFDEYLAMQERVLADLATRQQKIIQGDIQALSRIPVQKFNASEQNKIVGAIDTIITHVTDFEQQMNEVIESTTAEEVGKSLVIGKAALHDVIRWVDAEIARVLIVMHRTLTSSSTTLEDFHRIEKFYSGIKEILKELKIGKKGWFRQTVIPKETAVKMYDLIIDQFKTLELSTEDAAEQFEKVYTAPSISPVPTVQSTITALDKISSYQEWESENKLIYAVNNLPATIFPEGLQLIQVAYNNMQERVLKRISVDLVQAMGQGIAQIRKGKRDIVRDFIAIFTNDVINLRKTAFDHAERVAPNDSGLADRVKVAKGLVVRTIHEGEKSSEGIEISCTTYLVLFEEVFLKRYSTGISLQEGLQFLDRYMIWLTKQSKSVPTKQTAWTNILMTTYQEAIRFLESMRATLQIT